MSKGFIVLWMIFMHIVDDYYLQGWLASAKQKSWWEKNSPDKMYKYDYVWALLMHAFSWTFMVMLPIAFMIKFNIGMLFITMFLLNFGIHAITDDMKANKKYINLWVDQLIHLTQIILTAILFLCI